MHTSPNEYDDCTTCNCTTSAYCDGSVYVQNYIINNNSNHLPVPAIINGFAKGDHILISEHVHSRLACCNQLFNPSKLQCLVPTALCSLAINNTN